MNKIATLAALAFALTLGAAHAREAKEAKEAAPNDGRVTQQSRMKTCNADARGKKGDERKAFMKTCLSAGKQVAKK